MSINSQDPNDYSMVFVLVGWSELVKSALTLISRLQADGRPAQATLVKTAFLELQSKFKAISRTSAGVAHREIREHEENSRVRPDTQGRGGPRLGRFIGVSTPFDRVPGTVLINNERVLEDEGVSWWWTNEEGYSGHIGRRFIGSFDGTRPNPSEFRTHAVLDMRKGAKNRAKGEIKEPIPERKFVREGAEVAEQDWHAQMRAAKAAYLIEIRRAVTSGAPAAQRRQRP
jgi:hypothetical protein